MINYESLTNLQFANPENTEILADVKWDILNTPHRQLFTPLDTSAPHVITALQEMLNGNHGPIASYVPPETE